jgi:hypothetical protein
VITGAGRGIGREHALELARQGAAVVVNDLGGSADGTGADAAAAQAVVDEITAAGGRAVANADDVSDWDGAKRLFDQAILYALGVGAGAEDPQRELEFTTENSHGVPQQVLPTFAVVMGGAGGGPELGDFDLARLLHAEQSITVHGAFPASATVRSRGRLAGFYGKGADALIVLESETTDTVTGRLLAESRTSLFVREEGGFGGPRGEPSRGVRPTGRPITRSVTRRGKTRHCCTALAATATRCTPTRGWRRGPASTARSCTGCAPTASPAARSCMRCADPTRTGSTA